MLDVIESIQYAHKTFGKPVAETLVQSFALKFGEHHPSAVLAQATLDSLNGTISSPSKANASILANATVVIPNTRTSGTRTRGRSVE